MGANIPFHQDTFRPLTIAGNDTDPNPVEFSISMVQSPDLARLKSLMYAIASVAFISEWPKTLLDNVVDALRDAPAVFVNGVDSITNLTVPAMMARKVGIPVAAEVAGTASIAITTGKQFAAISGFMPTLAMEVAMAIAKISNEGDIDPRFFDSSITSPAMSKTPSGSVKPAKRRRARRVTVGS